MRRTRFKGKETGHRSGFEQSGQLILQSAGVGFEYEPKDKKLTYVKPETTHKYLPDYIIKTNGYHFEFKGLFTATDRKKILYVIEQNPSVKLIMVFQQPNKKLSKASKTTYAMWCDKNNIRWCTLDMIVDIAKEK